MPDEGDFVLYTVSQRDGLSRNRFRGAVDELYKRRARLHPKSVAEAPDRRLVLQNLEGLGHCDYDAKRARIVPAPPSLCLLPVPGLPVAVLAGARSPSTLEVLRIAEREMKGAIAVQAESQARSPGLPPLRISVQGFSIAELESFARAVGLRMAHRSPSWDLLAGAGSIDDYLASLSWSAQGEVDWQRWDFDLEALHFGPPSAGHSRHRLSRYTDPMRSTSRFRLWVDGRSAEVDPSWGRYALLSIMGKQVVEYDREGHRVMVPRWVPLPPILQRAAALCSGRSPGRQSYRDRDYLIYEGVPQTYAQQIVQKLAPPGAQEGTGGQ